MSAGNEKSIPPVATTTGNASSDSVMNWTIEYIKEGHFVRVTVTGIYNLKDHVLMLEDVAARNFWIPSMNLLIDDRHLDFQSTSLEELREAGKRRAELDVLIGAGKTAVLVSSTIDFVRARQYELITSGKILAKIDIFKDEEEALSWLLA